MENKAAGLFLAKFLVAYLVLQAIILAIDLSLIEETIARLAGQAVGLPSDGNRITINHQVFVVDANCTGFVSSSVLAALLLATKKPDWKKKAFFWIVGSTALLIVNVFRVALVLYMGKTGGLAAAQWTHVISWFITAVAILLVWWWLVKRWGKLQSYRELIE